MDKFTHKDVDRIVKTAGIEGNTTQWAKMKFSPRFFGQFSYSRIQK